MHLRYRVDAFHVALQLIIFRELLAAVFASDLRVSELVQRQLMSHAEPATEKYFVALAAGKGLVVQVVAHVVLEVRAVETMVAAFELWTLLVVVPCVSG